MLNHSLFAKLLSFRADQSKTCAHNVIRMGVMVAVSFFAPVTTLLASSPVQAQTRPAPTIQTTLSEADYAAVAELAQISQNNAAVIREIRADQLTPMIESLVIEMPLGNDDETEITLEPITLLAGLIQQPALSARLREERNNQRILVLEHYVAYLLAQQEWHLANLVFNDAVAELGITRVASESLSLGEGIAFNEELAFNQDYVYFANEMFSARLDAIVALESLASVVGISPEEVLSILTEYRVQTIPSQALAYQE
jgi:hypothetical protein